MLNVIKFSLLFGSVYPKSMLNTSYVREHFHLTKYIKVNIENFGNLLEVTTVIFARTAGSGIGNVNRSYSIESVHSTGSPNVRNVWTFCKPCKTAKKYWRA